MKKKYLCRNIILMGLFLFQALLPAAQNKKIPDKKKKINNDKEQILALEYSWLRAEFALDTAYLSGLMDDSFTGIGAKGTTNKYNELVDYYTNISQQLKDSIFIDSLRLENAIINLYGNTAVVTFVVHTFRKEKGVATERKTRFYDVWIKRSGKWKAVASQGTKVPE